MKREVGLWIDHHKTVMVTLVNDKEETLEVRSNIEKHEGVSDSVTVKKPRASGKTSAGNGGERKYGEHLSGYFDGVVSMLRNADSIWIFGPGEAKVELKKRLEQNDLGGRIVSIETVDKMTDRQIASKVRDYYQL
jgi:hypothetical protein